VVAPPNPVVLENQLPGTDHWRIGAPGFFISDDAAGQIQGYASATSVNKGGDIALHVSVNPAQPFTADVYRVGWYAGLGGRLMSHTGPFAGITQPECAPDRATGMVDCGWLPSHTLTVPTSWISGVYLVVLTNDQKFQSYVTFVVRDDERTADFLYQQSVTTYQAYNNYPDDGVTGKSLYEFNSYGSPVEATGKRNAAKVSFNRPYSEGYGAGHFGIGSWGWEAYFVGWLEQHGYDVVYSTNLDIHGDHNRLQYFRGFLSVGHDEYWSKEMRDAVASARDAGVSLGFFGANTAYWQVRFESSRDGVANRVMVCYKDGDLDPEKGANATTRFRDPSVGRPEQELIGIQYTTALKDNGRDALFVVQNSSHWVWASTGFIDGDQVAGILGYETDRYMPEYPSPIGANFAFLSRSPVIDVAGHADYADTSIYQAPSGAWVFATGTNHWSYGLGKPGVADRRIQQTTANVLDRFLVSRAPVRPPG
jgi:hypothetical protein